MYCSGCSVCFLGVGTFAGTVSGVHGGDGQGGAGWVAHASLVDGTHPQHVAAALHQARDWVAGKLDRGVVALDPVIGANLTPSREVTETQRSPKG